MSLNPWPKGTSHFKSETPPVSVQRGQKKKERQERLDAAYELVNKRDGNRCRVTGKLLDASSLDPATRREHHHLKGRRVKPEWRHTPERICLVSKLAHDLISAGWIECEGDDARQPLMWHWTKLAKSKPIVIKRHNKLVDR